VIVWLHLRLPIRLMLILHPPIPMAQKAPRSKKMFRNIPPTTIRQHRQTSTSPAPKALRLYVIQFAGLVHAGRADMTEACHRHKRTHTERARVRRCTSLGDTCSSWIQAVCKLVRSTDEALLTCSRIALIHPPMWFRLQYLQRQGRYARRAPLSRQILLSP